MLEIILVEFLDKNWIQWLKQFTVRYVSRFFPSISISTRDDSEN